MSRADMESASALRQSLRAAPRAVPTLLSASCAVGPRISAVGHFESFDRQKCAPVSCHSRRAVD